MVEEAADEQDGRLQIATVTVTLTWPGLALGFDGILSTLQFIHEQLATVSGGLSASRSPSPSTLCAAGPNATVAATLPFFLRLHLLLLLFVNL